MKTPLTKKVYLLVSLMLLTLSYVIIAGNEQPKPNNAITTDELVKDLKSSDWGKKRSALNLLLQKTDEQSTRNALMQELRAEYERGEQWWRRNGEEVKKGRTPGEQLEGWGESLNSILDAVAAFPDADAPSVLVPFCLYSKKARDRVVSSGEPIIGDVLGCLEKSNNQDSLCGVAMVVKEMASKQNISASNKARLRKVLGSRLSSEVGFERVYFIRALALVGDQTSAQLLETVAAQDAYTVKNPQGTKISYPVREEANKAMEEIREREK